MRGPISCSEQHNIKNCYPLPLLRLSGVRLTMIQDQTVSSCHVNHNRLNHGFTVHSQSMYSALPFPPFVLLQPYSKIDKKRYFSQSYTKNIL